MSRFRGIADFNAGIPREAGTDAEWLAGWDACDADRRAKRQHTSLSWSAGQALADGSEERREMGKRGFSYKEF